jgi:predicted NBD/HSP70 family sugar kinase
MRGCVEFMAGPHAIVAKAHSDSVLAHELGLAALPPDSEITSQFAVIATASAAGNTRARALLEESARYIAVAAHSVANILDLQMIVLTGQGFAAASDIYLPRLQETLSNSFFARSSHSVDVRLSRAAETAAAIGGAAIVLQSEFVPQRSASLVANVRKAGAVSELSTLSK